MIWEAGLVVLALGIAVGLGTLVLGRALRFGEARRSYAEPLPVAGSVGIERHQHIATVAAR